MEKNISIHNRRVRQILPSYVDTEGFARGGPTQTTCFLYIFLVDEGREEDLAARQRNAILLSFR